LRQSAGDNFHDDAVGDYPHSLVFQYSSAATGLKIRWPAESITQMVQSLRKSIEATWLNWSDNFDVLANDQQLGDLTVHVDGEPAE